MSEPERLNVGGDGQPIGRPSWCSGASLRCTRDEVREYRQSGVQFATFDHDPWKGGGERADVRVRCLTDELALNVDAFRYTFGVCSSCSILEGRHRAMMRSKLGNGGGR